MRASLDYGIETWDPRHRGVVEEPHHNTYDIEFWGADGMCTSFYLAALHAAVLMGEALGAPVPLYAELLDKGRTRLESELWNGEYFVQRIEWKQPAREEPARDEELRRAPTRPRRWRSSRRKGRSTSTATGCLADGVLGAWLAAVCGVPDFLDRDKLGEPPRRGPPPQPEARPERARRTRSGPRTPAAPKAGCCSAPGRAAAHPTLPFVYSNEVWTGIEYQVASHLMLLGMVEQGLEVVRTCRDRYDGRVRNPFDEYECGHWYARAMSSYALLQGLSGARYDAVDKILHLEPRVAGDFRSFLSTATGYGTAGRARRASRSSTCAPAASTSRGSPTRRAA